MICHVRSLSSRRLTGQTGLSREKRRGKECCHKASGSGVSSPASPAPNRPRIGIAPEPEPLRASSACRSRWFVHIMFMLWMSRPSARPLDTAPLRLRSGQALSGAEGTGEESATAAAPYPPLPRHFDRSVASGEIWPATGAGHRHSPVASMERSPGFSTPPRPGAGAPVEMTGWGCCHFATQGDDFRGSREIVRDRTAAHRQYPPCQTGRLSAAPGGIPKLSVFNPCVFPVPDVPVGRVTRQHWRGR